jgi:transposase-like protein
MAKIPSEAKARRLLESLIWPDGRVCPACGALGQSWALKGKRAGRGLYECRCRRQFTVTNATPMHGTKLGLRIWLQAMYIFLVQSKGISSVKLAQMLGVSQKSTWKVMHAIREMMSLHLLHAEKLTGVVEIDEKAVGGAPRTKPGEPHKRGWGTDKQPILVLTERHSKGCCGQARAFVIPNLQIATIAPIVRANVFSGSYLMTDSSAAYKKLGDEFEGHGTVVHSRREYVCGQAHCNTVESFNSLVEKANKAVFHYWSLKHMQRYLDEMAFRWNQRRKVVRMAHVGRGEVKEVEKVEPMPFMDQLRALLGNALGRQVRRTPEGSIVSLSAAL